MGVLIVLDSTCEYYYYVTAKSIACTCVLCDAGSANDGQTAFLVTDVDPVSDRCTIRCQNGKLERTFGRLLFDTYNASELLTQGRRVMIIEPDARDNGRIGTLLQTVVKGEMVEVRLNGADIKLYTGWSRNLIKI